MLWIFMQIFVEVFIARCRGSCQLYLPGEVITGLEAAGEAVDEAGDGDDPEAEDWVLL